MACRHPQKLVGARIEQFRLGFARLLEQVEHPTMSTNHASLQSFAADNSLSGREVEVLRLVAEGKSDKEIGCALSVSIKTVANHNRSIYAKCRVNGRNELLAKLFSLSGS